MKEIIGTIFGITIIFAIYLSASVGVLYITRAPIDLFSVSLTIITTILVSYLMSSLLKAVRKE